MKETSDTIVPNSDSPIDSGKKEITPLRCLFSSIISASISFCLYLLLNSIVQGFAAKTVTSSNPLVIKLTSAVRTMIMGVTALGMGVTGLIAIGIFLLGIQVMFQKRETT